MTLTDDVKIAAARLRRALAEDEHDFRLPRGRLIEKDEAERALTQGRFALLGKRSLSAPSPSKGRPRSDRGVTFHFSISHVSMRAQRDPAALPAGRNWVFPGRGEVAAVQALQGRYDQRHRAWHVPDSSRAKAAQYATARARDAWARGPKTAARGAHSVAAAVDFQRYIERADLDGAELERQLMHDTEGPVSIGNIGDSTGERAQFWAQYALAARRSNARIQSRIIQEIPHEIAEGEGGPERVRQLVRTFAEPFVERGLPYHLAVHWPEVDKGSDHRNVHMHLLYGERPTERLGPGRWRIGSVDRGARGDGAGGGAWAAGLRDRYAVAMNEALAEFGASKRYDPRSYRESGVEALAGSHLGPRRAQLERSGVPTALGVAVAERQQLALRIVLLERQARRARRVEKLVARGGDGERAEACVSALEELQERELRKSEEASRRARRERWLSDEVARTAAALEDTGDDQARRRLARRSARLAAAQAAMGEAASSPGEELTLTDVRRRLAAELRAMRRSQDEARRPRGPLPGRPPRGRGQGR